jgi:hypothetical protein
LAQRILLINPAVFDTRFLWARWQEPTLLAKVSTYFKNQGADVRYVDATANRLGPGRLRRERVREFHLDGLPVSQWRYGESRASLRRQLRALAKGGWAADVVVIECFVSFWWRGVREAAVLARESFPNARVAVIGQTDALVQEKLSHVSSGHRKNVRAEAIDVLPMEIHKSAPDWALGLRPPLLGYLSLAAGLRTSEAVVEDIQTGVAAGVRTFAFCDLALLRHNDQAFADVLRAVIAKRLKVKFVAPGTISVRDLVDRTDLLPLMWQAGYRQIVFSDDRHAAVNEPASWEAEDALLGAYACVIPQCAKAGFSYRTDALAAAISLGRSSENLMHRSAFLASVAHTVGSVIVWPYQPTSEECRLAGATEDRDLQNGKLFPLRHTSSATYRDYLNVLGLAVVLNSKHREHTFDFMGSGLIPTLFRKSLSRKAWEPDENIKGGLRLPVLPPRMTATPPAFLSGAVEHADSAMSVAEI